MGFESTFLFFSFAFLILNCTASPFPSAAAASSSHGRRPSWLRYVSNMETKSDNDIPIKRVSHARTPGYSANGRCGPKNEGTMCDPNSTVYIRTCCSSEGWCGSTAEYCADGCVSGCFNRAVKSQNDPTAAGRCGPSFGGKKCDANGPYGGCCGSEGWCGSTSAYCNVSEGCLSGCNLSTSSTLISTTHSNSQTSASASSTSSKSSSLRSSTLSSTSYPSRWTSSSTLLSMSSRSSSARFSTLPSTSHSNSQTSCSMSLLTSCKSSSSRSFTSLSTSHLVSQTSSSISLSTSSTFFSSKSSTLPSNSHFTSWMDSSVLSSISSSSSKTGTSIKLTSVSTYPSGRQSSTSIFHSSTTTSAFQKSLAMTSTSRYSTSTLDKVSNTSGPALRSISSTSSSNNLASNGSYTLMLTASPPQSTSILISAGLTTNSIIAATSSNSTVLTATPPPPIITFGGVVYTAIESNITSTTSSSTSVASIITISGKSYQVVVNSQLSTSNSPTTVSLLINPALTTSSSNSVPTLFVSEVSAPSSLRSSTSSTLSILSPSSSSSSSSSVTLILSTSTSQAGATFSPSTVAQAACANPFQSSPNGTNGLGLTVECFIILDIPGYLRTWIANNYPKVCSGSHDFSTCFTQSLGIFDAGTDCTGIKTASCTGFKYGNYAHIGWDVREIYVLQSIYGINQFFASWYNGLLGGQSVAANTIGDIVNRINPPTSTNILLNEILATLSFGLAIFQLPDEIVKAVQGLEQLEDAIRATPGFLRAFEPIKTTNGQLQIGQIQGQLADVVSQFLTQISNATAAIETNATAFTAWASTGLFIGNLVFLDQVVQDNYKMLNTFIIGEALNANDIVATVGFNTNVAQLQANSSDSLSYDIKCPSYDNNTMCNGWWYNQAEDATFALDNLKSMGKNMQADLSYFIDSGWTNGSLLFDGALKCKQNGGGGPTLSFSPGSSVGAMAQCFSSVKLCTWNLGCALDSQCEFTDCPPQSGFGTNGCPGGESDYSIYDFNVPYNYLGTFLTASNPRSTVCN